MLILNLETLRSVSLSYPSHGGMVLQVQTKVDHAVGPATIVSSVVAWVVPGDAAVNVAWPACVSR